MEPLMNVNRRELSFPDGRYVFSAPGSRKSIEQQQIEGSFPTTTVFFPTSGTGKNRRSSASIGGSKKTSPPPFSPRSLVESGTTNLMGKPPDGTVNERELSFSDGRYIFAVPGTRKSFEQKQIEGSFYTKTVLSPTSRTGKN